MPQAMYPEGGLTTDGRLRAPKLGLLDYMLKGFDPDGAARPGLHPGRHQLRPRARGPLAAAQARSVGGERRPAAHARDHWRASRRASRSSRVRGAALSLRLRLRQLRHAGVDARATSPRRRSTSARSTTPAAREPVAAVGTMLMARIGAVVPVLPVPLVATRAAARRGAGALRARAEGGGAGADATASRRAGAHVYVPRTDRDYALTVGLRMLHAARPRRGARRPVRGQPGRADDAALLRQLDRAPGRLAPPWDQKKTGPEGPVLISAKRLARASQSLLPAKPRSESSAWKTL